MTMTIVEISCVCQNQQGFEITTVSAALTVKLWIDKQSRLSGTWRLGLTVAIVEISRGLGLVMPS
jgi:hypothetical protein